MGETEVAKLRSELEQTQAYCRNLELLIEKETKEKERIQGRLALANEVIQDCKMRVEALIAVISSQ